MLETDLITLLSEDAGVIAQGVQARIYTMGVPLNRNHYPAITLQTISEVDTFTYAGPADLIRARVQVNAIGMTYVKARQVADAVRDALNGFRGTVGDTVIQGIFREDRADLREDKTTSGEWLYGVRQDFFVNYEK